MPIASLSGRAAIDIDGTDAAAFLQNLITTDVEQIAPGTAVPGALLTPQGKILFDFLIMRRGDGYRLDFRQELAADLIRRLTLYRLRSRVEFSPLEQLVVLVAWETDSPGADWIRDLRFADAPVFRHFGASPAIAADAGESDWFRLRIRHGVGESGADYDAGEAFPHDVLLDQNDGVSFRKGCFVGQEVVSRMQHRGTARRRLLIVHANTDLPEPRTSLNAGGKPIGQLGSVAGPTGLAMVRMDRVARALARGEPILAGNVEVTLSIPEWARFEFPRDDTAEEA